VLQMETEIITWVFLGIFGLFIFFKFKKLIPFKQDNRSINYYETKNFPIQKQDIIKQKEIKVVKKTETPIEEEDEPADQSSNEEDSWFEKLVKDNANIANEMFGFGKTRPKKGDEYW